ncbi:MAG: phosphoribosylanthranilate isomerase [Verrucomicrobia bacterium]|nr:phosphoribosylanthranilate isomerase [Verrucomicrobiota bacterium]
MRIASEIVEIFGRPRSYPYVKVCGITNRSDAEGAIRAGADVLGFNLYSGSKRYLELSEHQDWIESLPRQVLRIALLVNPTLDEAFRVLNSDIFDGLQLHGDESVEFCTTLAERGKPIVKAFRVKAAGIGFETIEFPVAAILLDHFSESSYGGTGQSFDWSLISKMRIHKPLIVAGGLTAQNVSCAIRMLRPYAVDVSSSVESTPRKKEESKIRAFIESVRATSVC